MTNLSQEKRKKMLEFLDIIQQEHTDDASLIAISEIESELKAKKYGLVWEHHEEAVDVQMRNNIPVFTEYKGKEITAVPGAGYNFLLEGDNLHSLRLLEKTHRGKIDVIYIDPPYNTGSRDFVYDDHIVVKEDGYRHSKWLSFMEARFRIAHELLSDQGLIFISIDDYEYAQLKLLCDEIFGYTNFINTFIWQRNSSAKTEKGKFTVNTEYVILYAKSNKYILNDAYKPLADATIAMYSKNDNDGRGPYRLYPLQKPSAPGPETTYDYVDNTGKIWKCPKKGWRMKYSKLKELENDGRLCLTNKTLSEKAYWNEREDEGKRIDTLWNDLAQNTVGSSELASIMGRPNVFNNPKPTDLVARCLQISHKNAIVLDFFAGSGTTGHAVLKQNAKDNGTRQFILCTNNENDICEKVTYERIKRVINGYGNTEGIPANLKYYRTDFVSKDSENITDELLEHIQEMVQLEHGIKLDGREHIMVLSDAEADKLEKDWKNHSDAKALYVAKEVLFTTRQKKLFRNVEIHIIPDYYFKFEMQEVGEIW